MSKPLKTLPVFIFLFFLAACGSAYDVDLGTMSTETEYVDEDTYRQNNCGGNRDAGYTYEQNRTVTHDIQFGGEYATNTGGSFKIDGVGVDLGKHVAANFSQTYGKSESVSRTISLSTAPGTCLEHRIQIKDVWKTGTAIITIGGNEYPVEYRYRQGFQLEQEGSEPCSCDGPPVIEETAIPEMDNTEETLLPPDSLTLYDDFNDACISTALWEMATSSQADPIFLEAPVDGCWQLLPDIQEDGGLLQAAYSAGADPYRTYCITNLEDVQNINAVQVDVSRLAAQNGWGDLEIFFRENDDARTWAYYALHVGTDVGEGQVRPMYANGNEDWANPITISAPFSMSLQWNQEKLHFYINDQPAMDARDFAGLSDTVGICFVAGQGATLDVQVDNIYLGTE